MNISGIGVHDTEDMIATAGAHRDTTWVNLAPQGDNGMPLISIFIKGENALGRARRMADAINAALAVPHVNGEQG